ncbi:MAG: DUF3786 domain-containing protein [Planctomycetota bacterium]|nr:DUF3786 domain-containing protein [Planctomycetota bacterium]
MAHEGFWSQLVALDGAKIAQNAKCQYDSSRNRYILTMLNAEYAVNVASKEVIAVKSSAPAQFLEQLVILVYLINAKDLPQAGELVKAETFPSGEFFFKGIHSLPTAKLEKAFGENPQLLYQAAHSLVTKKCEFGDASIELYLLPTVSMTIVLWKGDDEFPARASILFDKTAGSQMPLDALQAVVKLAVDALVKNFS